MKAENGLKLLGICSMGLLLSGCVGVHALPQETETSAVESEKQMAEEAALDQTEAKDAENAKTEEVAAEGSEEKEQVLDLSEDLPEKAPVVSGSENAGETENRNTGNDSFGESSLTEKETAASGTEDLEETVESGSTEAEKLSLEYEIKDQRLESGKTLKDVTVPEYAIAEDGKEVTGTVEWIDPDSGIVLEPEFASEIAVTGAEGDKIAWDWAFVPEEEAYQTVEGHVELTLYTERHDETDSLLDLIAKTETDKKPSSEKEKPSEGPSSASGSSVGASSVIQIPSVSDAAKWMGEAMTGLGVLGNKNGLSSGEASDGKASVSHGTVLRDEIKENSQTEVISEKGEAEETEAESASEKEETDTTVKAETHKNIRRKGILRQSLFFFLFAWNWM